MLKSNRSHFEVGTSLLNQDWQEIDSFDPGSQQDQTYQPDSQTIQSCFSALYYQNHGHLPVLNLPLLLLWNHR